MSWLIVTIVGLMMGSFATLLTHRYTHLIESDTKKLFQAISSNGSYCKCGQNLEVKHLIPVFSYLWQRGKTDCCNDKLSIRYPLIELASLAIALIAYVMSQSSDTYLFGFYVPNVVINIDFWLYFLFMWGLLVALVIDLETMLLPDRITLPLMWLGLMATFVPNWHLSTQDALIGAASGYLILWVVYQAFLWIKNVESLGYGDFKLSAAIGSWIGYQYLSEFLTVAAFIGIAFFYITKKRKTEYFPFGPAIALSGLMFFIWGLL